MLHASAIAGAFAGLVSSILTCPLDVVKTRLQAQGGSSTSHQGQKGGKEGYITREARQNGLNSKVVNRHDGLSDIVTKIWKEDGVRGFYRGLGPTIFGYLPTWAIYFTVYDSSKAYLAESMYTNGEEDFFSHILSAMTAGLVSTCCTSPLWVVKTRFMLQSTKDPTTKPYRHTGDAFVQIYKTEGIRGFYRGLLPSLFGVSHVAVQFPLYEQFKAWAREKDGVDEISPGVILTCSSSAKMIASVLTYPHEVLRTRLQMQPKLAAEALFIRMFTNTGGRGMSSIHRMPFTSPILPLGKRRRGISHMGNVNSSNRYTGVIQACVTIAREEGIRGFYRGMGVNLIRTVPSSALTILTYEVMMQHLTADSPDHDNDGISHENK
ncbi:hypothetical protein CBS101457_006149 [Exobasidium rhododendri]|nr:hypothetical protein CBS101457_006149 [Exobasidium rhododendri]